MTRLSKTVNKAFKILADGDRILNQAKLLINQGVGQNKDIFRLPKNSKKSRDGKGKGSGKQGPKTREVSQ